MQQVQRKMAVTGPLAAAFALGLAAFAVSDPAEARKGFTGAASGTYKVSPTGRGGVSTLPTTGKAKANPSPIVRDHRGQGQPGRCIGRGGVPNGYGCQRGHIIWKYFPKKNIRDHRAHPVGGSRVVPKEDPPQKW